MLPQFSVAVLTSKAGLTIYQKKQFTQYINEILPYTATIILRVPVYSDSVEHKLFKQFYHNHIHQLEFYTTTFKKRDSNLMFKITTWAKQSDSILAFPTQPRTIKDRVWDPVERLQDLNRNVIIIHPKE